jgi:PIN domain nuclease of toxin-antitoxin system
MRLLLDTSTLLWFWLGGRSISDHVLRAIKDRSNEVYVSPLSAMEIANKHRIGKLPGVENIIAGFDEALADDGFIPLPLNNAHSLLAGSILAEPRDPFDRMLAGQAIVENLTLVSPDLAFDALGARRLW